MDAAYVLVHSLLLGPLSWAPVAARLAASGAATAVPSLVDVTDVDEPPFWPRVTDTVNAAVDRLPAGRPVVVVAHSNAGLLVPVIAHAARRPVAGCLFVDARLPARTGPLAAATPERLAHLRSLAAPDGGCPRGRPGGTRTTWPARSPTRRPGRRSRPSSPGCR